MKKNWNIFFSSVFFVLGFSVIFSLLGVVLQSIFSGSSYEVQKWLGRVGGILVIIFGLYITGLIKINFLEKEYKFKIKRRFSSSYLTSFIFGAAFAVGWTPCIGAILGAILTLAISQPSMAFLFLLSYSLGLGIPFMLVGLFTNQAQNFIAKFQNIFVYLRYLFGAVLIVIGMFVFTSQLSRIASFPFAVDFLINLDAGIASFGSLNLGIAFIAGIVSFLSPCVLPLIPAFLMYLASAAINKSE
ncbi:sulfite exporter TauE/SafE family protein [Candidatus Woesearchaeota archaeon]|nr:sulfite exporter TauE/SafE family protein [Candidatus Woesearchaeota archaeon]